MCKRYFGNSAFYDRLHSCKRRTIFAGRPVQLAVRISDKTVFFLLGEIIEAGDTEQIFSKPKMKKTEDYITGRFG